MNTTILLIGFGLVVGLFVLFMMVSRPSAASARLEEVARASGTDSRIFRPITERRSWRGWRSPLAVFVAASGGSPTPVMSDA